MNEGSSSRPRRTVAKTLAAAFPGVDGVLSASPHEQAWRNWWIKERRHDRHLHSFDEVERQIIVEGMRRFMRSHGNNYALSRKELALFMRIDLSLLTYYFPRWSILLNDAHLSLLKTIENNCLRYPFDLSGPAKNRNMMKIKIPQVYWLRRNESSAIQGLAHLDVRTNNAVRAASDQSVSYPHALK